MYFFIHNKELRNAYDTYKVIENLRNSGFQDRPQDVSNNTIVLVNNGKDKNKK